MSKRKVPVRDETVTLDEIDPWLAGICEAALKGGAAERDVVALAWLMGRLEALDKEALPLAKARAKQLAAIEKRNAGREVTQQVRAQVTALFAKLAQDFPKKSHRYDEIDRRMEWKRGRARYVIEGPRKSKMK